MDELFDPKTLAEDLAEVHQIYSRFFAALDESDWDKPVKGSPKEWNLHETVLLHCLSVGCFMQHFHTE